MQPGFSQENIHPRKWVFSTIFAPHLHFGGVFSFRDASLFASRCSARRCCLVLSSCSMPQIYANHYNSPKIVILFRTHQIKKPHKALIISDLCGFKVAPSGLLPCADLHGFARWLLRWWRFTGLYQCKIAHFSAFWRDTFRDTPYYEIKRRVLLSA